MVLQPGPDAGAAAEPGNSYKPQFSIENRFYFLLGSSKSSGLLFAFLVFPEVLSRAADQASLDSRHPVVEQPEKTSLSKKCRTKVLLLPPQFVVC